MSERRSLGVILRESGRITDADVESALEHQKVHGGFFGEALITLGLVGRDEIDWALASQFDLPYIFPDPDSVDRDAAARVPADWALSHLAVPIIEAGGVLTVVAADPLQDDAIDELQSRTGLQIELALASRDRIRELIRTLYDQGRPRAPKAPEPVALSDFLSEAIETGAERFGLSIRSGAAWGWYERGAGQRLKHEPLADGWREALGTHFEPSPSAQTDGREGPVAWAGTIQHGGRGYEVDAQALVGRGGAEYVFHFEGLDDAGTRAVLQRLSLPAAITAELRLVARSGGARVAVAGDDPALVRTLLPHLPARVLEDDRARIIHLDDRPETAGDVYVVDPGTEEGALDQLKAFRFDAITADLPADAYPLGRVLAAAPLTLVFLRETDWRDHLRELGVGWILNVRRSRSEDLSWDLQPADA